MDTDEQQIIASVRIFSPGIDEKKKPKNEKRRRARALRRLLRRRAARKWKLRRLLTQHGWLPVNPIELAKAMGASNRDPETNYDPEHRNPWLLRAEALSRKLTTYELGRVFVHLNQRRGYRESEAEREHRQAKDEKATIDGGGNDEKTANRSPKNSNDIPPHEEEAGKVKAGLSKLESDMTQVAEELRVDVERLTYGQFMAHQHFGPTCTIKLDNGHSYHEPIRNRLDSHRYHAGRELIRKEFQAICDSQAAFGHSSLLLGQNDRESIERLIFFQRRTYWKRSSLRRCELVPTDERVFKADRYAQEFRMLETVNRMKIGKGKAKRPLSLSDPRREQIIRFLTTHIGANLTDLLAELDLPKGSINLEDEKGDKMPLNSDWFAAKIIHEIFDQSVCDSPEQRHQQVESVNRAIQSFPLERPESEVKLRRLTKGPWRLSATQEEGLIEAWRNRPAGRVGFSRRALIELLLPRMRQGMDVESAKLDAMKDRIVTIPRRLKRYLANRRLVARKPLPPPPDLPNPVVRRALHVVRRYVNAYIRTMGMPDQIVVELTKRARQTEKARLEQHARNQKIANNRDAIVKSFDLEKLYPDGRSRTQAIRRIELYQQQVMKCPYCGETIKTEHVKRNVEVEIEHVIPRSRGGGDGNENRLLVHLNCNRNKRDLTIREFLGERFDQLLQHMRHFEKEQTKKWNNLTRSDVPNTDDFIRDEFRKSQLPDTGYIAIQTVKYLRESLGIAVLMPPGRYTKTLRVDWGLSPPGKKDRTDHRHHAADAIVIALADEDRQRAINRRLMEVDRKYEQFRTRMRPDPVPEPWTGFAETARTVTSSLIVSHEENRKIEGEFHKEKPMGKASEFAGLFTARKSIQNLNPKMLNPPKKNVHGKTGEVTYSIEGKGKSLVIRDQALRELLKVCLSCADIRAEATDDIRFLKRLAKNKKLIPPVDETLQEDRFLDEVTRLRPQIVIDPDNFDNSDVELLTQRKLLRMPNGYPIKCITVMRSLPDPLPIPCGDGVTRFFPSESNHHIEIVEVAKPAKGKRAPTTEWLARPTIIPIIAAQRVRPSKHTTPRNAKRPIIDRSCRVGERFVMSLCKGDMIFMRSTNTENSSKDYFVVVKITGEKATVVHHADAGIAPSTKGDEGVKRREILLSADQLREREAVKVRIGPLGEIIRPRLRRRNGRLFIRQE